MKQGKDPKHHKKPLEIIEKPKDAATTIVIPEQFIGQTSIG
jgi:hypothetical protein